MFDSLRFMRDHWSSHIALHEFIRSYGFGSIDRQAVYKWYRRGTIPAVWTPVLLALLEMEYGHPVSLVQYMKQ